MADAPDFLRGVGALAGPSGRVMDEAGDDANSVGAAIGTEARIMLKRVRVPDEGPLTEELRSRIRETVKGHLKQHEITYREVSRQVDVGESTISEVLKGTYTRADPDGVLRKLNLWIDDDERRRQRVRPLGFYATSVFIAIRGLANFIKSNARTRDSQRRPLVEQESSRIAIGWGPAGCGKSIGAKALHAEDTLSLLVRVDQRRGTDLGLARLINESAGLRGAPRGQSLVEFVMERLRDSGRLLIIDEGHRLKPSGCEFVRDLADVCGIPILILATQEFYDRLTRVRTCSGNLYYDQFSRRVGYVCDLVLGLDGRGGSKRPIFSLDEIRAVFHSDQVRVASDAHEYLQACACAVGIGMLGLAANIWEVAFRAVVRGSKQMTAHDLRRAAKRVLIPAGANDADDPVLKQIEKTLAGNREIRAVAV